LLYRTNVFNYTIILQCVERRGDFFIVKFVKIANAVYAKKMFTEYLIKIIAFNYHFIRFYFVYVILYLTLFFYFYYLTIFYWMYYNVILLYL